MSDVERTARQDFRVLTQTRGGYEAQLHDVQLQSAVNGGLVWAQTFSDQGQAEAFRDEVDEDLALPASDFRRKYGVPSTH